MKGGFTMTHEELIEAMEYLGYFYDDIDSYEGFLFFIIPEEGLVTHFNSWEQLEEWYQEVCD